MLKPIKPWQVNTHLTFILCLLSFVILLVCAEAVHSEPPNVLWIVAEDTSPWMGCYGDKINALATPNIDSLAESGIRFARAFVPAPVCSPCRSAMMAGQYPFAQGHETPAADHEGEWLFYLQFGQD